jgi:KaiC/GvpD/RAD55 family RecA-like ATPase
MQIASVYQQDGRQLGKLPPEIVQFFSNPGGHSLLIKGPAGTGKTTLALQLLETIYGFERNFYLSSRVSDRTLLTQFPWLIQKERTERLLLASRSFLNSLNGKEPGKAPEPQAQAPRPGAHGEIKSAKVLLRELSAIKGVHAPDVVDRTELTRVGGLFEPEETADPASDETRDFSAYQSLMVDFNSDMPEIERLYERVENALPDQICVALDSVDALAEKYGIPATRIVNMLQKDLVENTNTNIVLVVEHADSSQVDYLVDGVVSLSSKLVEDRAVRELSIQKLRGCSLERPRHLYTLAGGRLTSLLPAQFSPGAERCAWTVLPGHNGDFLSTGSRDLDRMLGSGFHRGSINLIEVGRGVPNHIVTLFAINAAANFLGQGHAVFWLPTRDLSGARIRQSMEAYVSEATLDDNLRILEVATQAGREHPAWMIPAERDRLSDYIRWDMIRHLVKGGKPPVLHIMSYDALETKASRATEDLAEHYIGVKEHRNVDLSIVKSSVDVLPKVADFASTHIRLEKIDGTVVAYGEKPHTGVFHVSLPPAGRAPEILLTPLV